MVVDLGKAICTCGLWQLSGMPCVHACAAMARAGRQPEDFCHRWLTMDAYNDTYAFHINPIPGQKLWEKSLQNRPQPPKFRKMPGAPKKKRRKGVDEGPVGDKKQKITKMKRVYKEGSCRHCGGKGHDKRNCAKKKADDEAAAVAAAAAAAAATEANTRNNQQPLPAAPEVPDEGNVTEIEVGMSQPMVSENENENEEAHPLNQHQARPPKLPQKRRQPPPPATALIPPAATRAPPLTVSNAPPPAAVPISNTPPPTSASIDPMVGASAATASRLRNAMRFVPTPGFKPPRKFNK
ncbi:hypothetical protein Ahy_B06g085289 isoform A [Arachis hypogaea]|uniref:SWIM-type domain-containing protein n=4 Tax=Arachis hypogaea TaxID=3818 RepID=A0A444YU22_ARAHY|nr:hypothetical protein Ahy_B06g085289 isoform A [Arachis hypogaea]